MANSWTNVARAVLRYGVEEVRSNSILPKLINTNQDETPAEQYDTIEFALPVATPASAVTPGTAQATDLTPLKATIQLNKFYQAGFALTAKDMREIDAVGLKNTQSGAALEALINQVESDIIALGKKVYTYSGSISAAPDGIDDFTTTRRKLNINKAPKGGRAMVVSSVVEDNFLQLTGVTQYQNVGNPTAVIEGELGRRYGFQMGSTQNMDGLTWNDGTQDGAYLVDSASVAIGDTSVNIDTGTGTILQGAIFTVAGDTQTYVCTSDVSPGGADSTLNFSPPAKVAWADDAAITFVDSHKLGGLAFHRNWATLVTRPVQFSEDWGNVKMEAYADPVSGIVLMLKKEYKDWKEWVNWAILYGVDITRHELCCRMLSNA